MKTFLLSIFFILTAISANSSAQTINLKLSGIDIGTPRAKVLKTLGKPLSSIKRGEFPCDNGPMLTLRYSGLTLKMLESNDGKDFIVGNVIVTSNKWSVSGIKIGASVNDVKNKFGNKDLRKEEGFDALSYLINDGYAAFFFKKNKLIKIAWELNVC